jgi:hypothetical protein
MRDTPAVHMSAHANLPITNAHSNALTEDLHIAFDRVGVSYPLQNQMIALLARRYSRPR